MAKSSIPLTQERLKELLSYDPETGVFTWRTKRCPHRDIGSSAGTPTSRGYWSIIVDRNAYQSHRLAWLYAYGRWPAEEIDHINGNKLDNRIDNLRESNRLQNTANRKRHRNNKSGHKGVFYNPKLKKWRASFTYNGNRTHLGYFADLRDAAEAYQNAAQLVHGEFARVE